MQSKQQWITLHCIAVEKSIRSHIDRKIHIQILLTDGADDSWKANIRRFGVNIQSAHMLKMGRCISCPQLHAGNNAIYLQYTKHNSILQTSCMKCTTKPFWNQIESIHRKVYSKHLYKKIIYFVRLNDFRKVQSTLLVVIKHFIIKNHERTNIKYE